jgi:elongation factor G
LEILIDRLFREYKVHVNVGKPHVSYREAVQRIAIGEHTYERLIAGDEQYAYVELQVEHFDLPTVQVQSKVAVSKEFKPEYLRAIELGIRESAEVGPLAGYPLINLKVTILNVKINPEHSSEMAFKAASALALRGALAKSEVQLLEPNFKIEIICPDQFVGSVVSDISARKGKILSLAIKGKSQVILAEIPLARLFGYATDVRSLSQGRASFSMEFKEYSIVAEKHKEEILKSLGRIF